MCEEHWPTSSFFVQEMAQNLRHFLFYAGKAKDIVNVPEKISLYPEMMIPVKNIVYFSSSVAKLYDISLYNQVLYGYQKLHN
jgi:hypothetical protein